MQLYVLVRSMKKIVASNCQSQAAVNYSECPGGGVEVTTHLGSSGTLMTLEHSSDTGTVLLSAGTASPVIGTDSKAYKNNSNSWMKHCTTYRNSFTVMGTASPPLGTASAGTGLVHTSYKNNFRTALTLGCPWKWISRILRKSDFFRINF